jgi:hypothetical protein
MRHGKLINYRGVSVERKYLIRDWDYIACQFKNIARQRAVEYDGEVVKVEASIIAITPGYTKRKTRQVLVY